jgi:hypothetical protein
VKLTWVGTPAPLETRVTRADAPKVLEYSDTRWEFEALGGGTRLTLWHNIDRRFVSWGAAGWHISFDVLDRLLSGTPIGRIVGAEAMKLGGWQRLNAEYAKQFGMKPPNWSPQTPQKSWIEDIAKHCTDFRGGPLELEQMGSASPPLTIDGLYGGRHRQHRGYSAEEVFQPDGAHGGGPAGFTADHRSVLVRAAVCR